MRNEQVEELIVCTRENGERLESLGSVLQKIEQQNKDFVRWLLLVVCIIALGSKAAEMAQRIWGHTTSQVEMISK